MPVLFILTLWVDENNFRNKFDWCFQGWFDKVVLTMGTLTQIFHCAFLMKLFVYLTKLLHIKFLCVITPLISLSSLNDDEENEELKKKQQAEQAKRKKNLNAECEELFLTDSFTIIAWLPVELLSLDQKLWQYVVSLWLFEIPIERLRV